MPIDKGALVFRGVDIPEIPFMAFRHVQPTPALCIFIAAIAEGVMRAAVNHHEHEKRGWLYEHSFHPTDDTHKLVIGYMQAIGRGDCANPAGNLIQTDRHSNARRLHRALRLGKVA